MEERYRGAIFMAILRILQSGAQEDVYLNEAMMALVGAYTANYDLPFASGNNVGPLLYKGEPVTWQVMLKALEDLYPNDLLVRAIQASRVMEHSNKGQG